MNFVLEVNGKRDAIRAIETLQDYLKRCRNVNILQEFKAELVPFEPDPSIHSVVEERLR